MSCSIKNKVALITGCSGGIGKEIATYFSEQGANLIICARNESKLNETAEICRGNGVKVLAKRCDVTSAQDLDDLMKAAIEMFGTVDILVNNAVNAKPGSPLMEQTEEYLDSLWESGFKSTWKLMRMCFPYMKEKGGKIINFGSASGLLGVEGYSCYGAVKEAIRGLSRVAAREWGPYRINVNVICPTAITPSTQAVIDSMPEGKRTPEALGFIIPPLGRVGDAFEDIAPVVAFLASEASRHITGQTFRVDGGGTIFSG